MLYVALVLGLLGEVVSEDAKTALASTSLKCQSRVTHCIASNYNVQILYTSLKYCEAIRYSTPSFASLTCLVVDSGCTLTEYFRVRNAACGTSSTTGMDTDENVGIALVSSSQQCRSQVSNCISSDTTVENLYTSLKYCEAIRYSTPSFASLTCLVVDSGCTLTEYFRVRNAACGTSSTTGMDTDENVGIALVSNSQQCRSKVNICISSDTRVKNLYASSKYCEALQYSAFYFIAQSCLVGSSGCTQSEYDSLKRAACTAISTTGMDTNENVGIALVGTLSMFLCSLIYLFTNFF
ncbi:hypothetical protein Bpfe_007789 [Biomphalaria pfeifferi]|uniref:Uncharacterized protein n=1 Tax=Biomphalaria pfeifferi TaxID=112525 RepID=A0AAD8FGS2_BIOPF|nr:hypothetical protein Bpfe_007789 [Biomphalaria pfeifferi]